MRLLHTSTLQLSEFFEETSPHYAVLSHTWGDEEVSFKDMQDRNVAQQKAGYMKIKHCCDQAARDNLQWAWVDTCCIDKSSSAELSEAINSMFRWYRNAQVCYAYLSDVPEEETSIGGKESQFGKSRWFTRGWTLQELLAPRNLVFYNGAWIEMGRKLDHYDSLSEITGVDPETLGGGDVTKASIAKRMSWASARRTTRTEDIAYCLMGIFDINMPLLYGEGKKAFVRLQEEILKFSDDHSLFAWIAEDPPDFVGGSIPYRGLLAQSPAEFASSGNIVPCSRTFLPYLRSILPHSMTNRGLRISLPKFPRDNSVELTAALLCRKKEDWENVIAIVLHPSSFDEEKFVRTHLSSLEQLPAKAIQKLSPEIYIKNEIEHEVFFRVRIVDLPHYYIAEAYPYIIYNTKRSFSVLGKFIHLKRANMGFHEWRAGLLFNSYGFSLDDRWDNLVVVFGFVETQNNPWCNIFYDKILDDGTLGEIVQRNNQDMSKNSHEIEIPGHKYGLRVGVTVTPESLGKVVTVDIDTIVPDEYRYDYDRSPPVSISSGDRPDWLLSRSNLSRGA